MKDESRTRIKFCGMMRPRIVLLAPALITATAAAAAAQAGSASADVERARMSEFYKWTPQVTAANCPPGKRWALPRNGGVAYCEGVPIAGGSGSWTSGPGPGGLSRPRLPGEETVGGGLWYGDGGDNGPGASYEGGIVGNGFGESWGAAGGGLSYGDGGFGSSSGGIDVAGGGMDAGGYGDYGGDYGDAW